MNKKLKQSELILGIIIVVVLIVVGIWWFNQGTNTDDTATITTSQSVASSTTQALKIVVENKPTQTVSALIASLPNVSTFASYYENSGVSALITGKGPYTIFIPTNSAFSHQKAGSISGLNLAGKKRFVEYHIVTGRAVDVDALSFGTIQSMSRDNLNFSANQAGEPQVNSSFVLHEYKASNGIVYIISEVLLPPTK